MKPKHMHVKLDTKVEACLKLIQSSLAAQGLHATRSDAARYALIRVANDLTVDLNQD